MESNLKIWYVYNIKVMFYRNNSTWKVNFYLEVHMGDLTKNYVMAYFDILGYKDIVLNDKIAEDKLIAIIYRTTENLLKVKNLQSNLEIKTYFFSDNCVICCEKMNDIEFVEEVAFLIFVIQIIQRDLLCSFGILIRGAILEGNLYLAENFIYGKGIIEAYNIENNVAVYPRIIVSTELMKNTFSKIKEIFFEERYNTIRKLTVRNMFDLFQEWKANILFEDGVLSKKEYNSVKCDWKNIRIRKDFDGYYFVDFLYAITSDRKSVNKVLRRYKKEVILGLKENRGNKKVIIKYLWCVNYAKYYFEKCGSKEDLNKDEIEKIIGFKIKEISSLLKMK